MAQTPYLLWFTISAVLAQVDDLLYCSFRYERLCQGKGQHVACKYPHRGPGEMCENYTAIIFSEDLKQFIIHYINRRRQRIASGHERVRGGMHLPKPEIMMMVQWDRELAALAQRLADQCQFVHDDCRATVRYPYAGQTVGEVRWRGLGESMEMGARRIIRRVFDAWWGERRRVQARQLTSPFVLASRGAVWGHFSQLAVWSLRAVGCGAVHHGYSKPRLLLVCDFSHTNMLGQRTISPGPLAPCPLHTTRVAQSPYPLLCAPAHTEIQKHNEEYRNYRDEEYEMEQDREEIVEPKGKMRLSKPYEHDNIASQPRATQYKWAEARLVKPQEPKPKESEPKESEQKESEPNESEPKETDEEEEGIPEEETPKPRPIKSELAPKRPYYDDDDDEPSKRYSFESEEKAGLKMNRPEDTDDTWVPNRPIKPLHDVENYDVSSYIKLVTRGRSRTLGPVTESDRYEDDHSNNDSIIRQKLNKELSLKESAKELENREMRYKAALKYNTRDDWTMKSKGEYKASNGKHWGSFQNSEEEQWRETQDVIPLRSQNANRLKTTVEVYRPTVSISTEPPIIRHRWKQPRQRLRRPGVNALLQTPTPKVKVKSSLKLDKEDENQLFLDTGFKLS